MDNLLEAALRALDALRSAVESNEGRPAADAICAELTRVMALIGEYAGDSSSAPAAVPYVMEGATISKIEEAMNTGARVVLNPDGQVSVYPQGASLPQEVTTVAPDGAVATQATRPEPEPAPFEPVSVVDHGDAGDDR